MFRLLKLKPPHGWNAVAWELAIVTLGVIIALVAQQWAQNRDWSSRIQASKAALRDELAEHYNYAVEYRAIFPCLEAQVATLRDRVLHSGNSIDPAPVYHEQLDDYVLRMPVKFYPTDVWEGAISDGVVQRFEPSLRRQLAGHYASLANLSSQNALNDKDEKALFVLSRPLALDPSVRYAIIQRLDELSGRLQFGDIQNGQVIDYVARIGMVPPANAARAVVQRYGTYKFCKAHGLPMRSFEDAMQAVQN
jgi:hypothetical protein